MKHETEKWKKEMAIPTESSKNDPREKYSSLFSGFSQPEKWLSGMLEMNILLPAFDKNIIAD